MLTLRVKIIWIINKYYIKILFVYFQCVKNIFGTKHKHIFFYLILTIFLYLQSPIVMHHYGDGLEFGIYFDGVQRFTGRCDGRRQHWYLRTISRVITIIIYSSITKIYNTTQWFIIFITDNSRRLLWSPGVKKNKLEDRHLFKFTYINFVNTRKVLWFSFIKIFTIG